jgi:hypothetical protein
LIAAGISDGVKTNRVVVFPFSFISEEKQLTSKEMRKGNKRIKGEEKKSRLVGKNQNKDHA